MRLRKIPASWSLSPLTSEKAWFLGLMFGDGNLNRNGKLSSLCGGDIDVLDNVSAIFGGSFRVHSHQRLYVVNFFSPELWKEMAKQFGLTPAKAHTMRFPVVPFDVMPHFVRGLFDTDGSFFNRREHGTLQCSYASASRGFVEDLRVVLAENRIIKRSRAIVRTGVTWSLQLNQSESVKMGYWIYTTSTAGTRCSRKYEVWKAFVDRPPRSCQKKAEMVAFYRAGFSTREVAKIIGTTYDTVEAALSAAGEKQRTKSEALRSRLLKESLFIPTEGSNGHILSLDLRTRTSSAARQSIAQTLCAQNSAPS